MRKVAMRNALLCIGMSVLVLVAVTPSVLAKNAAIAGYAMAHIKTTRPAHFYYARHWKRGHRALTVSRRLIGPPGHILVHRRSHRRPRTSDETDQLFACLLSQPFVICP
jgi:hypothetical protein